MAWLARDKDETLGIFGEKPTRDNFGRWRTDAYIAFNVYDDDFGIGLPTGADEKLIGRHIAWDDEPVEI